MKRYVVILALLHVVSVYSAFESLMPAAVQGGAQGSALEPIDFGPQPPLQAQQQRPQLAPLKNPKQTTSINTAKPAKSSRTDEEQRKMDIMNAHKKAELANSAAANPKRATHPGAGSGFGAAAAAAPAPLPPVKKQPHIKDDRRDWCKKHDSATPCIECQLVSPAASAMPSREGSSESTPNAQPRQLETPHDLLDTSRVHVIDRTQQAPARPANPTHAPVQHVRTLVPQAQQQGAVPVSLPPVKRPAAKPRSNIVRPNNPDNF